MRIAVEVAVLREHAAAEFLEVYLVDFCGGGELGAANENLVDIITLRVPCFDYFTDERNPFHAEAINPEVNIDVFTVTEDIADGIEGVVPVVEGHFAAILGKDDILDRIGIDIGKLGLLILVDVGQLSRFESWPNISTASWL